MNGDAEDREEEWTEHRQHPWSSLMRIRGARMKSKPTGDARGKEE